MGEGWGQAVGSSDLCPSEYLIHLHYLLVWFNMACIMKRSTATSNMPPDSSPKEAVCTCRRSSALTRKQNGLSPFRYLFIGLAASALPHVFNWSSISVTKLQYERVSDGDALEWIGLDSGVMATNRAVTQYVFVLSDLCNGSWPLWLQYPWS